MPIIKLTDASIQAVKVTAGRPVLLWDTVTSGFGVRVTASKHAYIVQFRPSPSSSPKRIPLGYHPTLAIEKARVLALRYLTSQVAIPTAHSVSSLIASFITDYIDKRHKPHTQRTEKQLLRQYVLPHLGDEYLTNLTRAKIVKWHSRIPSPIAANRALAHLSKACSFAVARDWMPYNPCVGVERNKEITKDRWLTDYELKRLFARIKERDDGGAIYTTCVILALTGMRCGEVLSDFDFNDDRKIIWLVDSKTGPKSVALNKEAHSFIKAILGYVKPGYRELYDCFMGACFELGIKNASPHTLRHTHATFMAEHGDSAFQIASMGGWKSLSMVQRYVNLHGVGEKHPTPAGERIAKAIGLCQP